MSNFTCTSETEEWESDSNQESTRTSDSQATSVQYVQLHPKAMGTGQASEKGCPGLMKPSTDLPCLATARPLHLLISNAQVAWLDCFLMNTDIPSNIHLKHQQHGVGQTTPKVYLCSWGCHTTAYCCGVFPQGHNTALVHAHGHYSELGVWCLRVGQDGCRRQTHSASSESYVTHIVAFHGVFTSRDPQTPN